MAIPQPVFYWGARLQNRLDCGWPLEAPVTYPVPRPPSALAQAADASAEDGWYVGTDYMLEADVRYVPAANVPGLLAGGSSPPNGMDALLTWARQRGKVRFVPDRTVPGHYVDGYVVDPWSGAPAPEGLDGSQRYHLKLRSDHSYAQALRGLFFEYQPGMDIGPFGLGATYSRGTMSGYIGRGGPPAAIGTATSSTSLTLTDNTANVVPNAYVGFTIYIYGGTGAGQARRVVSNSSTSWTVSVAWGALDGTSKYIVGGAVDGSFFPAGTTDHLMDRHYPLGYSGGALVAPVTTLLQGAATNKLTAPEDLSNAAWTGTTGTTVPSINNTSPRGDATASFLREDTSNGVHQRNQSYTIVAGQPQGLVFFLKANGRTKARIGISDFVAFFYSIDIDLVAATLTPTTGGAGSTVMFSSLTPLANGWFKVEVYGVLGGAATAIFWDFKLLDNAGAVSYLGDGASGMYIWGCVATTNQIAGMYWGVNASRNADVLSVPWPARPQAGWFYIKFIEGGAAQQAGYPGPLAVSDLNGALPMMRFFSEKSNGQATYGWTFWDTANNECNPVTGPAQGDTVELLGIVNPDGTTSERLSINGGADIVNSNAAKQAFPVVWAAATLWIGGPGGATSCYPIVSVKAGPLTYGGLTIDTMAKARAA